ncbi:hypothetical protein AX774_g7515 [Zancudomyces culisetae]|uniref:Uncharacterized protein n=1 Tax=Zancudomyces culisetae TaxID=1213189 RepID=A0A1R1PDQ5_ZANCU|nr:hypothetical protein AX774_g7515 [Zancudomyces culisetae]|eukprot:OMH79081.1 hypothetical protein AX774_g7515 [Zancudomyces culisetae]
MLAEFDVVAKVLPQTVELIRRIRNTNENAHEIAEVKAENETNKKTEEETESNGAVQKALSKTLLSLESSRVDLFNVHSAGFPFESTPDKKSGSPTSVNKTNPKIEEIDSSRLKHSKAVDSVFSFLTESHVDGHVAESGSKHSGKDKCEDKSADNCLVSLLFELCFWLVTKPLQPIFYDPLNLLKTINFSEAEKCSFDTTEPTPQKTQRLVFEGIFTRIAFNNTNYIENTKKLKKLLGDTICDQNFLDNEINILANNTNSIDSIDYNIYHDKVVKLTSTHALFELLSCIQGYFDKLQHKILSEVVFLYFTNSVDEKPSSDTHFAVEKTSRSTLALKRTQWDNLLMVIGLASQNTPAPGSRYTQGSRNSRGGTNGFLGADSGLQERVCMYNILERALLNKDFSISVFIKRTANTHDSREFTALLNEFVKTIFTLPDKIANSFYYKIVPEVLSRDAYFDNFITDVATSFFLMNEGTTDDGRLLLVLKHVLIKVCRFGYSEIFASKFYQLCRENSTKDNPKDSRTDESVIILIKERFVEVVSSQALIFKERIIQTFLHITFTELLEKIRNFGENTSEIDSYITQCSVEYIQIWFSGIKMEDIEQTYQMVKLAIRSMSKAAYELRNQSTFDQTCNIAGILALSYALGIDRISNRLILRVTQDWGSKTFINSTDALIEDILINTSGFLLFGISCLSNDEVYTFSSNARFMEAVYTYFEQPNSLVRLATTVLTESVVTKSNNSTHFSKSSKNNKLEDSDFGSKEYDFGLDQVIRLAEIQSSQGDTGLKTIRGFTEANLVTQLRLLSKINKTVFFFSGTRFKDKHYLDSTEDRLLLLGVIKKFNLNHTPRQLISESNSLRSTVRTDTNLLYQNLYGNDISNQVFSSRPDSLIPKNVQTLYEGKPTMEFVKPKLSAHLSDILALLRSSKIANWEIKYDAMKNLGLCILLCDRVELVRLYQPTIKVLSALVYGGPAFLDSDHEIGSDITQEGLSEDKPSSNTENRSILWDTFKINALVCLFFKMPELSLPFAIMLLENNDLSITDKSLIFTSISTYCLTYSGDLEYPKPIKMFMSSRAVNPPSSSQQSSDKPSRSKDSGSSTGKPIDFTFPNPKKSDLSSSSTFIQINQVIRKSRKLTISEENNKQSQTRSIKQLMEFLLGKDKENHYNFPTVVSTCVFFPLVNMLFTQNPVSNIHLYDNNNNRTHTGEGGGINGSILPLLVQDLNFFAKFNVVLGISVYCSANSPHQLKMISEYLSFLIFVIQNLGIYRIHHSHRSVRNDDTNDYYRDVDNSGNTFMLVKFTNSLTLGLYYLVREGSNRYISKSTLLSNFSNHLVSVFHILKGKFSLICCGCAFFILFN